MTGTQLAERPSPRRPAPLRGDETELYRRHHHALLRRIRSAIGAPEALIEDACQLAWLALCVHQPEREYVLPWLVVVARREAYRLLQDWKRARPASSIPVQHEERDPTSFDIDLVLAPERDLLAGLEARQALETLAALKPRQREALTLKVAGFSYREIGALTDSTYRTVDRQLARARASIRALRSAESSGSAATRCGLADPPSVAEQKGESSMADDLVTGGAPLAASASPYAERRDRQEGGTDGTA